MTPRKTNRLGFIWNNPELSRVASCRIGRLISRGTLCPVSVTGVFLDCNEVLHVLMSGKAQRRCPDVELVQTLPLLARSAESAVVRIAVRGMTAAAIPLRTDSYSGNSSGARTESRRRNASSWPSTGAVVRLHRKAARLQLESAGRFGPPYPKLNRIVRSQTSR